jgi:hypothetical protein
MKKRIPAFLPLILCSLILSACGVLDNGAAAITAAPSTPAASGTPRPSATPLPVGGLVADHRIVDYVRLGSLPVDAIQAAKANLHIAYGHTSHGYQLSDGMQGLIAFAEGSGCAGNYSAHPGLFSWNTGGLGGALDLRNTMQDEDEDGTADGLDGDCGYYPAWYDSTRSFLNSPKGTAVNVIIWSWCGQAGGYTEEQMLSDYLQPMAALQVEYPDVTFVYMTCHLQGTGTGIDGNLHARNEQIRAWCAANHCWLFDFADIESYAPGGTTNYAALLADDACNYDADGTDGLETWSDANGDVHAFNDDRNWAEDWMAAHTVNVDWYDCPSAHSRALNANLKAYAAWWLWARLAGWNN